MSTFANSTNVTGVEKKILFIKLVKILLDGKANSTNILAGIKNISKLCLFTNDNKKYNQLLDLIDTEHALIETFDNPTQILNAT